MPQTIELQPKRKISHSWRKAVNVNYFGQAKHFTNIKPSTNVVTWKTFVNQYEKFTDILCAAAKNGCDEGMEREYDTVRKWFVAEYYCISERLKPYLAHLNAEVWTLKPVPFPRTRIGFRRADILESIFKIPTLKEILDTDAGDLIYNVTRLSEAVYQCDCDCR